MPVPQMGATAASAPPAEDAMRLLLRYFAASALPQVEVLTLPAHMAASTRL